MTSLRVPVSDETVARLQALSDDTRMDLEKVAGQWLDRALKTLPVGRALVVQGEILDRLEATLGGGSLLNEADLAKKVARLAGISFLHVRLPFTPNQLEELAEKAKRNSLTVEQLVNRTAPRIYEHFFDLVARI